MVIWFRRGQAVSAPRRAAWRGAGTGTGAD